ncbi:MAG: D-alanine--D-alanine ligase [Gammaproteobacteria bacterium]
MTHKKHRDSKERIALLAGGTSSERAVSLESGRSVLEALAGLGFRVEMLDPAEQGFIDRLRAGGFTRAFNILHGGAGEDGSIQGLLEILKIPYTGSGVLGSALSCDKNRTKALWQALGLPTPAGWLLEPDVMETPPFPPPWCVKPVDQGSSVGVSRVETEERFQQAVEAARFYSDRVLVEPWIAGGEYTVGFVGEVILPSVRIETPRVFYDYVAKYEDPATRYHCPSGLPARDEAALGDLAWRAARALGVSGWGRVDFMLTSRLEPYLIEVNVAPGMTSHSLVPMAAREVGWSYAELCQKILAQVRGGTGDG